MTLDDALRIVLTQLVEETKDAYGEQADYIWAEIKHIAEQSQITTE